MFKQYLALCAIAAVSAKEHYEIHHKETEKAPNSDHWAVIVAGSNQFYNYRH